MLYDHLSSQVNSPTDEDFGLDSQPSDTSPDTASECSVQTPGDTASPPMLYTPRFESDITFDGTLSFGKPPLLQMEIIEDPTFLDMTKTPLSPPRPRLKASFVSQADFYYDRYSTIMDDSLDEEGEEDDEDEPEDLGEIVSAVQTATPVSYLQPKSRPSVISIVHTASNNKSNSMSVFKRTSASTSSSQRTIAGRPTPQNKDIGFLACEATPLEIPDDCSESETQIDSREADHPLDPQNLVQDIPSPRRPSIDLLSAAAKYSHSRVSSIKSYMKTPTSPQHSLHSSISRPSTRQGRPPLPRTDTLSSISSVASSRPSSTVPRSQTARTPARRNASFGSVAALSMPPTPPPEVNIIAPAEPELDLPRKKSFSMLRRRSESIGQALKSVTSRGRLSIRPDMPPLPTNSAIPTTPVLRTPTSQLSVDLGTLLTPPPSSPRPSLRTRASYSPFPPVPVVRDSSGTVGLGLRRVDGLH